MTTLPKSTIANPRQAPAIRWGVMAPGRIAHAFARAVEVGTDSTVVAVGSRSLERARAFAETHGVPAAYGSYEEVAADPETSASTRSLSRTSSSAVSTRSPPRAP